MGSALSSILKGFGGGIGVAELYHYAPIVNTLPDPNYKAIGGLLVGILTVASIYSLGSAVEYFSDGANPKEG